MTPKAITAGTIAAVAALGLCGVAAEPPALLSQTGAFADVRSLTPAARLVAYDLNVPFWSDGAAKRRWVALPDGGRVRYSPNGEWGFPAGALSAKHIELSADGV